MIKEKIVEISENVANTERQITDMREFIDSQKKELEKLEILEKRLKGILTIRYYENIGLEKNISELANRICLGDLLHTLTDAAGLRLDYNLSAMSIMNLTIWQTLALFYGDHTGHTNPEPPVSETDNAAEVSE